MKKQSTTIISIILLIIIVIFALLNTAAVEINLLFTKIKVPLVLLIFVCFLIGALIIYLFSLSNTHKINKELKELRALRGNSKEITVLKKQTAQLQKENASLKKQLSQANASQSANPSSVKPE